MQTEGRAVVPVPVQATSRLYLEGLDGQRRRQSENGSLSGDSHALLSQRGHMIGVCKTQGELI